MRIKICDFGISRPLTNGTSYTNTGHSTIIYAAPEVHGFDSNGPEDRNRPAVDLWSLGCVIYELVVGQSLFRNLEDVRKFYNDQLGGLKRAQKKLNNGISKEGIQFFSKLLQVSYEDRPTTTQALNHPWLSQKVQHLTMVRALPVQFSERIYLASVPEQREELVRKARESLSKNVDIRAIHALEKWWRSASSQMLYIIDQSSSDAGSLVGLASLEAAPNYVIAYFGNHRTPPDERNSLTDLTSSLVRQLDHCLDTDPDNLDYHYPFFDQAVSGIRERIGRLPAQDRLLVIFDGFQHLDKTLSQAEKKNISSLITVLTSIDSRTNVTIKLLLVTPGPTRILSPPIVPGKQTVDINNKILSSGPLHPELRRIYRLV